VRIKAYFNLFGIQSIHPLYKMLRSRCKNRGEDRYRQVYRLDNLKSDVYEQLGTASPIIEVNRFQLFNFPPVKLRGG